MNASPEQPATPDAVHVAIGIITYRRPQGLRRLLTALDDLVVDDSIRCSVVVVDNDPEASARPVADEVREHLHWPLTYVVESERGIPFARNRVVREAAGADFVAFIDDDEVPEPAWIAAFVAAQRRTGADVVTGPVEPVFEEPPERWIVEGGFFDRPRFRTDERVSYATTSSVLISTALLQRFEQPFNEQMRFTGGTDTHFFIRARNIGATMVWADDAVVREHFPASRANLRWILARQYRRGNTQSLCHCDIDRRFAQRARQLARGVWRIAGGIGATIVGLRNGRAGIVRGLQRVWLGAGIVTGVFRIRYQEYRTLHGS